jgi:replicative DNA helicase
VARGRGLTEADPGPDAARGASGPGSVQSNRHGHGAQLTMSGSPSPSERLPPQNLEAERSVLGSILLDNEPLHDIVIFLRADDFYRDAHQVIYAAIRDLYDSNKAIDAVTLAEELKKRNQFDQVGGHDILTEIVESVPTAANAVYYANIVKEKATNRQLIESATEIIRDGYSNQFTAKELLEAAEHKVFSIAEDQVRGETLELKDIVKESMDLIMARAESGGHAVTGVASGLLDLDDMTGGFHAGQLIILAARPSMGKTALALNIAEHAGINLKIPVLFISLEMGRLEIGDRMLCSRSRVDGHKLRTGISLGHQELTQLGKAYNELTTGQTVFVDDTPTRNMLQVTASARRMKRRNQIGLILVDYIQLIDSEDSRDSRQEQIAKISRRLKAMARALKLPVIALSQLNRAVETREDKRPRMADLRESGAIEQDADIVLLLHRPDYYEPTDQPGIAVLDVAKNRNGATGNFKLAFIKKITRFENLATLSDPMDSGQPF